jgi:hypothetical protein
MIDYNHISFETDVERKVGFDDDRKVIVKVIHKIYGLICVYLEN